MTTPPGWLKAVCSADASRPTLHEPFRITFNGGPAIMATNGHLAVILPGEWDARESPIDPAGLKTALGHFAESAKRPGRTVALDALRGFVGVSPAPVPCDACHGTRLVECGECVGAGTYDCECDCGHEHERECRYCKGAGEHQCSACGIAPDEDGRRRAWLGETWLNIALLEVPLVNLSGDVATWHEPDDPNRVRMLCGDGWFVGVMPLRQYDREEYGKDAPRFDGWNDARAALAATEAR